MQATLQRQEQQVHHQTSALRTSLRQLRLELLVESPNMAHPQLDRVCDGDLGYLCQRIATKPQQPHVQDFTQALNSIIGMVGRYESRTVKRLREVMNRRGWTAGQSIDRKRAG